MVAWGVVGYSEDLMGRAVHGTIVVYMMRSQDNLVIMGSFMKYLFLLT